MRARFTTSAMDLASVIPHAGEPHQRLVADRPEDTKDAKISEALGVRDDARCEGCERGKAIIGSWLSEQTGVSGSAFRLSPSSHSLNNAQDSNLRIGAKLENEKL